MVRQHERHVDDRERRPHIVEAPGERGARRHAVPRELRALLAGRLRADQQHAKPLALGFGQAAERGDQVHPAFFGRCAGAAAQHDRIRAGRAEQRDLAAADFVGRESFGSGPAHAVLDDRDVAVRRAQREHAGDVVADRDRVVGGQPGTQQVAQAVGAIGVVLGQHDRRPIPAAEQRQHHLPVIGGPVHVDHVEALGGDPLAQPENLPAQPVPARLEFHVEDRHVGTVLQQSRQAAAFWRRHGHAVMAAHRDGEIADIGVLAAAVIAVEVGVQNVHHA
ncbi:hypothetical protein BCCR75500_07249 (plasmid) [Burkholderia sola]|nr:hypothetical protein BCCR75500_07249 [Burkholderia cenocepacia]CAG2529956.1 hypothetical protein BCCR75717_07251 [Burkholderia cenocepacia]